MTAPRPCFSFNTGSTRPVSIICPRAFFASRADMVLMTETRGDQSRYWGRNAPFLQALAITRGALRLSGSGVDTAVICKTEDEGKIKGRTLRRGTVVCFQ
ncbi:MAG: hypothetical protein P4L64_15170 [Caulobacteraceae bacterium]|jgi:hypothetical protein|nr:hypothetical protein [Caulobacteraceae bacterium]